MIYRTMGRTGAKVGIVGLGMEHLEPETKETLVSVVRTALDNGVNYFDLFMATPDVRDAMGEAIRGRRKEAMITGHLGAVVSDGKTIQSRDPKLALAHFEDLLTRLGTDYIDTIMLFFVDEKEDYDRTFAPGGLADIAIGLKKAGKARFIGMSSHSVPSALRAVRSGIIDILMFPVNPTFDLVPGNNARVEALWESETYETAAASKRSAIQDKRALYAECARRGVAVVAMKPFAAGWLFWKENPSSIVLSPVQALHYALSQPGIVTAVPGCKSVAELEECLAYLEASEESRDYSAIATNELWKLQDRCMYCNHCLPCPAGIDIGRVSRLSDTAKSGMTEALRADYLALEKHASDCIQCSDCMKRCPFGIDVIDTMAATAAVFGA